MSDQKCSFPGCTNTGRLRTYTQGSVEKLTKKPWCDSHATAKLQAEARIRRKEERLAEMGVRAGEVEIGSHEYDRLSYYGYAPRKIKEPGKPAVYVMNAEGLASARAELARKAQEEQLRRAEEWQIERKKEQEDRERKKRDRRRPVSHALSPEVVLTNIEVDADEEQIMEPPEDGYVPWGSPMVAQTDDGDRVVQAWRMREG